MQTTRTMRGFVLSVVILLAVTSMTQSQSGDVCETGICRCSHKRVLVDCSGTNINSSTFNYGYIIPAKTRILNLSNTEFQSLKDDQFEFLQKLIVLDLFNASIGNISSGAFKGLGRLRYLNISKNENYPLTDNTTSMSPDLFKDLTSLVDLKMYGTTTANLPHTYPNTVLSRLTSLSALWIDGMNNKTLGRELVALTNLRILRFPGDRVGFGFCDIDTLKDYMFSSVTNLTHLYITNCGIQVLEINVFTNLTRLEYMDLSGNVCLEMDGISEALKKLIRGSISTLVLNSIYYTNTKSCGTVFDVKQVEGLSHLNLTTLYVEDNAIVKITTKALKQLPKTLTYLGVRDNEFEPGTYLFYIKELTSLEGLDASYQFFPNMIWFQQDPPELQKTRGFGRSKMNCRKTYSKELGNLQNNLPRRDMIIEPDIDKRRLRKKISKTTATLEHHSNSTDLSVHVCALSPHKVPPIVPFLPPNMKYVDLSHCKLNLPIYNLTVDDKNSVQIVNASNSMLTCWEGPVYGLKQLEFLDLRNNLCERVGPYFFSEFPKLQKLLLSGNLLDIDIELDTAGNLLNNQVNLQVLDIENNRLRLVPPNFLIAQIHLQSLNLRKNMLTEFNVKIGHMRSLTCLNLSHNSIPTLPRNVREDMENIASGFNDINDKQLTVDLSANYIHCYCVNLDFLKWLSGLEGNPRLKVLVTNCSYETDSQVDISNIDRVRDAIAYLEKQCASKLPLTIGLTAGIVLFTNIVVGITVHVYRWKLRYWWYVSRVKVKVRSDGYTELETILGETGCRWKYDVYVAYASEERETDFVKEMIEYIESRNHMRLCDSDRDFVPGQSDYRMISNAIHVSRVSIFVITDKSTRDGRWEIAMRMSQEESINRGKRAYFGIFLDGIPRCISENKKMVDLNDLVKANAFLEYPTGPQNNVVNEFWNRCVASIREHGDFQQES